MRLTAPTPVTFAISIIVALLALAVKYLGVGIPIVQNDVFLALAIAYVVLLLGNLVRGL